MKKRWRTGLCALLAVLMLCSLGVGSLGVSAVDAPEEGVVDGGVYLYNLENDFVLLDVQSDKVVYPAASVKIMTGILAVEALGDDLGRAVIITEDMLSGVSGNSISLSVGETVTVEHLLYALISGGANDAAHALAVLVSGSVSAFVAQMNDRAKALGAANTFYTNPSGMHDEGMFTTTADTAKIALHAYQLPLFSQIAGTAKYTIPETNAHAARNIYNRNYLVCRNRVAAYYYSPAVGLNAGSTRQAGYCVTAIAQQGGQTYLCVVMGGRELEDGTITAYTEAKRLLDAAFKEYGTRELLKASVPLCEMPVNLSGMTDHVTLVTKDAVTAYLPLDIDLEAEIEISYTTLATSLDAPVEEGQVAGMATVLYGDKILGTTELVASSSVQRSDFLAALAEIKAFTHSRFFIVTLIAALLITIVYILIQAIYRGRQKKIRRYRR